MGGERESTIRENDSDREGARPKRRVGAAEGVTLAPEGEPLAKAAAGPTISVPLAATFVLQTQAQPPRSGDGDSPGRSDDRCQLTATRFTF